MFTLGEDSSYPLKIAVAPACEGESSVLEAVRAAGGRVSSPQIANALIWTGWSGDADQLRQLLEVAPDVTWVQLPSAGVERYASLIGDGRVWTCAKGIYAPEVGEHAVALALAGLHNLPHLARDRSWHRVECRDLDGGKVTIVGGGGIADVVIRLLEPFHVTITVVRNHTQSMTGVDRVVGAKDLLEALTGAGVVFLAPALTPETQGMIGFRELRAMGSQAWLVNVGRGKLVITDDLVQALRDGVIAGAALDVTDPEPLPDGHPLWGLDNCLITPHCSNPPARAEESYAQLVRENIRRRIAGDSLLGWVDANLGY